MARHGEHRRAAAGQDLRGRDGLKLLGVGDGGLEALLELWLHDEARLDAVAPRATGARDREPVLGDGRPDEATLGRDDRGAGCLDESSTGDAPVTGGCPCMLHRGCLLRSEEHTSELQSLRHLVCRLLLEKQKSTY